MDNKLLDVLWTGSYPSLCSGEWQISYNNANFILPEDLIHENMLTDNTYYSWQFDANYAEEWTSYEAGLACEEWRDEHKVWIAENFKRLGIEFTDEALYMLYSAIQKQDWRHNSCGGCI